MRNTKTKDGGRTVHNEFKADKPFTAAPQVTGEYTENGTRYYRTLVGGPYIADVFDRNFKVSRSSFLKRMPKLEKPL